MTEPDPEIPTHTYPQPRGAKKMAANLCLRGIEHHTILFGVKRCVLHNVGMDRLSRVSRNEVNSSNHPHAI